MLDINDKSLKDGDLHDIVDRAQEGDAEESAANNSSHQLKCERICRNCIRSVGKVQNVWYCVTLLSFIAAAVVLFVTKGTDAFNVSDWGFEHWVSVVVCMILVTLSISRIASNNVHLKQLKNRTKYLRKDLPKESDRFMRELYFMYCKRRCTHFWLTVGFGSLFMLCMLYPILACGIDMLASWQWTPKYVKLFDPTAVQSPESWGIEHKFFVMGAIGVLFCLIQFFFFRDSYHKAIYALEERYGREQIIDECLYCSRMWKVNFRYKSFAFMIVCFCGCFFYLLFKRLICNIFDKSFTF